MAQETKLRIVKFASEYDIPTSNIVEFLKGKGYEIKGPNSIISPEMLNDLKIHFKKDIEKAEAKIKKVSEFKGSEQQPKEEKAPVQEKVEETKPIEKVSKEQQLVEQKEEKPEEKLSEEPKVKIKAEEPEKVQAEQVVQEDKKAKIEEENKKEVVQHATQEAKKDEVVNADQGLVSTSYKLTEDGVKITENESGVNIDHSVTQKYITDTEKELQGRQGLRVVGKVDLDKGNRHYKDKNKRFEDKNKQGKENFAQKGPKERHDNTTSDFKKGSFQNKSHKDDLISKPNEKINVAYTPTFGADITSSDESKREGKAGKKAGKDKKGKKTRTSIDDEILDKKKKAKKKPKVDEKEVEKAILETLAEMDDNVISERAAFKRKKKKEKQLQEIQKEEQRRQEEFILKVTEYMTVSELAERMNVSVGEVIQKAMELGTMVSINQRLELEMITLLADEFGYKVEEEAEYTVDDLVEEEDKEEDLQPRPPIVTVMGHVDHGKTTLLDFIRNTNVVAGESGGITQHIGAYKVELPNGKSITFLDTPGHEAFTAMRARGAKLTDIVILVVAADDSVMPQTIEAINHAQAAGVPIIVAINKVDKPGVDIEKIKRQLAEHNVLVEDWGGKYQCVEISAKKGMNIDVLLEKVLLEAELLDLKANPYCKARGAVVEAELDKGRGVVSTILVQKGTLRVGDPFVVGIQYGRVRAMFDERGNKLEEAGPSTPVQVLGFEGMPQAGDNFVVVDSEKTARNVALKRQQVKRQLDMKKVQKFTLDEFSKQIQSGQIKNLPIIVKGDVDGSIEALADSFMKLSNDQVRVDVIHKAVGGITESDVLLATASKAIIIGFHVRPNLAARKLAETENIEIRLYNVIYDAINDIKAALEGLLAPVLSEEVTGTVEVREVFKVPKVGTVAGCYVLDGKIKRSSKVTVIREGIEVFRGEISTLKRFKDDVREVDAGYECGLTINNFNDIKVGDIIEVYQVIETKQVLE